MLTLPVINREVGGVTRIEPAHVGVIAEMAPGSGAAVAPFFDTLLQPLLSILVRKNRVWVAGASSGARVSGM